MRPRLFTRPLPVLAAMVLLLNDHWLKGSGLLPGWATGKLSDFAGLYFAPLLVAELWLLAFPARDARGVRRRVWASAVVVGALFCSVKVSAWASARYVEWVGRLLEPLGWTAHNVVDPTDLVALLMLPLALRSGRYPEAHGPAQSQGGLGRAPMGP